MSFFDILKMVLTGILPCFIVVLAFYCIARFVFHQRVETFKLLFIFYFMMLLYVTLFRFQFRGDHLFNEMNLNLNLLPLVETYSLYQNDKLIFLYNTFGNMIWFMPMGYGIAKLSKCTFYKTILFALICSIMIECLQLVFLIGTCDIDDVIFNTIGALIGSTFYYKRRNL
ncbi:MAG: VanZ family protein [Erysipelotrichaceae bacterium]